MLVPASWTDLADGVAIDSGEAATIAGLVDLRAAGQVVAGLVQRRECDESAGVDDGSDR